MSVPSLERRLSAILAAGIIAIAILAAVVSFALSFNEAKEFQDDALQQIGAMATSDASEVVESRITVLRTPRDALPRWLPDRLAPGFHTIDGPGGPSMRVFVRDAGKQGRVIVLQDTGEIDEVAFGSALEAFIPAVLLIPLVAWLSLRVLAAERRRAQAQRRFIADAAHELRSPLTALSLQAENLDAATSVDAVHARAAALRGGIARAQRVAEQMLAMARLHNASQFAEIVEVADLVREVIAEALELARRRGVDLGLEEETRPLVRGSAENLRLIVKNGIDNAIRYTESGGSVTVRVRHEGPDAIVEVQDDGPGIPQELAAKVFEPFCRGHTREEGAGLGLSIARDAAEKMGGAVTLRNTPAGHGLVFTYRQRIAERARIAAATA